MTMKETLTKLQDEGWHIKEDYLSKLLQDGSMSYLSIVKELMNADIKEYGLPCLNGELLKGKTCSITVPLVLQVTNVRNLSAPKANEESTTAPRMLRVTLTDGTNFVQGLEVTPIKFISLKTAPGTKLKLVSKMPVAGGHLMLNPSAIHVLGGTVEELFQKWKLSQSVSKYQRTIVPTDGSGPPPWVPFGGKIEVEREKDFRALADPTSKKKEDDDFENQRQKVVSELVKESSGKVFGGGKQMLDSNVRRIINYGGFTIEEAEWALKKNKYDVQRAMQELKRMRFGGTDVYPGNRDPSPEDYRGGRSRGGRRGRGRGRGKEVKGPDGSDDETPLSISSRPSATPSLFDFLEPRIGDKTGDAPEPPPPVERRPEVRYERGRWGRGRGERKQHQKSNPPQPEPSFAVENWPTLGQEPEADSKPSPQHRQYDEKTRYQGSGYGSQNNYSPSQSNYNNTNTRYNQHKYNYHENHRGAQASNKNYSNYRESYSNYREKQSGNKDTQPNFRGGSHNYRGNTNNYRGNSNYRDGSNYRNTSNYQGNSNNQDGYSNYREAPSYHQERYSEKTDYYDQSTKPSSNYTRETQPPRQAARSDSQRYDQEESSQRQRKPEQSFYRPGAAKEMQRGNNVSRGSHQDYGNWSSQQSYNQPEEKSGYSVEPSGRYGGQGETRVHTAKERELIAMFEKTMVMRGFYDAPRKETQNRGGFSRGSHDGHAGNYNNYQEFSGTYEYHRGGDGYARRSRRQGRY